MIDFDEMKSYLLFTGVCLGFLLAGYILGKL